MKKAKYRKYQSGGDFLSKILGGSGGGMLGGASPLSSIPGLLSSVQTITDGDKSNNGTGYGGAIGGALDIGASFLGIPTFGLGQAAGSFIGGLFDSKKEPPKSFRPSGNTTGYYQFGGYVPTIDTNIFSHSGYMDTDDIPMPINIDYDILRKGGWIQKATAKMKKKGTVGSFTRYCGGKVTNECIQRALNSSNPKIRKKAQFAKAMRSINK